MTSTLTVIHPGIEASVEAVPQLAARINELVGKRIALLDNGKVNAGAMLAAIAKRLQLLGAGDVRVWKKQHASTPAEKEIPLLCAWEPDLALVALGD